MMKLLNWPLFALCLMSPSAGHAEDFETFLLPELKKRESSFLKVKEADVIIDRTPVKGQSHSIIPWADLDPDHWMSVDKWLADMELKAKIPDWKLRLRDENQKELAGKILSCKGSCPVFRGSMKANGQYLSRIEEGDEIRTDKDSVLWLYLMDGTLVRLSPETSLSLQEINFAADEVFIFARLNKGHIFWHSRTSKELPLDLLPETDSYSLPLKVLSANQQNFEREIFGQQTEAQQLAGLIDIEDAAINNQVRKVNELRASHKDLLQQKTKFMVVVPNGTLTGAEASFDIIFIPGGKGYFKVRHLGPGEGLKLELRGYNSVDRTQITEKEWFEIDRNGRTSYQLSDVPGTMQLLELITKRIRSIELARELWIQEFSVPVYKSLSDGKKLGLEHGYTLWGKELKQRQEFLSEYNRRIETTNIKSLDNLLQKIEDKGLPVAREMKAETYQYPLNYYLMNLKNRYTSKKVQVREMNNLQYYVWALRDGKL